MLKEALVFAANICINFELGCFVLQVHGLLHLLGFDHEISDEAEAEMEKEEELILKSLGWKGKGLIQSAYDAATNGNLLVETSDGKLSCIYFTFLFSFFYGSFPWMHLFLSTLEVLEVLKILVV